MTKVKISIPHVKLQVKWSKPDLNKMAGEILKQKKARRSVPDVGPPELESRSD